MNLRYSCWHYHIYIIIYASSACLTAAAGRIMRVKSTRHAYDSAKVWITPHDNQRLKLQLKLGDSRTEASMTVWRPINGARLASDWPDTSETSCRTDRYPAWNHVGVLRRNNLHSSAERRRSVASHPRIPSSASFSSVDDGDIRFILHEPSHYRAASDRSTALLRSIAPLPHCCTALLWVNFKCIN